MSSDPHQGGRLEDMAATGTTVPGDAGKMNTIPSVPRPDQKDPGVEFSHTNPLHAADNAFDIPRSVNDRGQTAEVISGIGDQMPANVEKKNLDDANFDPRAKGHVQYAKHARQDNPMDSLKHGAGDHGVQPAPGEEQESEESLLNKRGAQ
ncbi:Nop-like protein [Stemphylium lycopersici]|uniref:Nop-like protein n=1 Tax=Stemphylium lycopersici TaxID=183478 RepID=A0A364MZW1_STELY|nr:Nop-like protein [Stemphylium lycopersici]RAR10376.1 Nop-like protein [Stemphylium lycopersici]